MQVYGPSAPLPTTLRRNARWRALGAAGVPALLVHPDWLAAAPCPAVIWLHGRTVHKELDPGRYLRWMRAGIGTCALDLPGHGERFDEPSHDPGAALDVVVGVLDEIDPVIEALGRLEVFDMGRLGIGGVSAGGMATLVRLCREHPFAAASVEAASGSWRHQAHRPMLRGDPDRAARLDPIGHLDAWREIPFQAIHSRGDELVSFEGQAAFVGAVRRRYRDPGLVDFIQYDHTGAPHEHAGFGRMAADAKNRQAAFFKRWLTP